MPKTENRTEQSYEANDSFLQMPNRVMSAIVFSYIKLYQKVKI